MTFRKPSASYQVKEDGFDPAERHIRDFDVTKYIFLSLLWEVIPTLQKNRLSDRYIIRIKYENISVRFRDRKRR